MCRSTIERGVESTSLLCLKNVEKELKNRMLEPVLGKVKEERKNE